MYNVTSATRTVELSIGKLRKTSFSHVSHLPTRPPEIRSCWSQLVDDLPLEIVIGVRIAQSSNAPVEREEKINRLTFDIDSRMVRTFAAEIKSSRPRFHSETVRPSQHSPPNYQALA